MLKSKEQGGVLLHDSFHHRNAKLKESAKGRAMLTPKPGSRTPMASGHRERSNFRRKK